MTTWTSNELDTIGAADELQIASRRNDGTLTNPVTIWAVRLGENLYVRSVRGHAGGWYRATQVRHEGHIQSAGLDRDVTFADVTGDANLNDQLDAVYRTKYRRYAKNIVDSIVTPEARATTLKVASR